MAVSDGGVGQNRVDGASQDSGQEPSGGGVQVVAEIIGQPDSVGDVGGRHRLAGDLATAACG